MKSLTKKTSMSAAVLAFAAGSVTIPALVAADVYDQQGFQINPGAGHIQYDSAAGFNNGGFGIIGLEYMFQNGFSLEGSYLQNGTEDNAGVDNDFSHYRMDALYYFGKGQKLQPYLSVGGGRAEIEPEGGVEVKENLVNGGFGARYFFTPKFSLRGDARYFEGRDSNSETTTATATVSYLLGGEARKAAPPVIDIVKAPLDSDNDGVNDEFDQCGGTVLGHAVDASGCSLDSDKDGLADANDVCPNTPAGAKVDASGCEVPAVAAAPIETLDDLSSAIKAGTATGADINLDVKFGNNTSYLSPNYIAEVEALAEFLKAHKSAKVTIEGHSDSIGDAGYNKALSEKRANHIKQLLVERFKVSSDNLIAVGIGEAQPIASNDTAAGRKINRRVTATIVTE